MYQPFVAPDWTDLRAGFFVSVTKSAADDDPTGLAEAIPAVQEETTDRYWMGLIGRTRPLLFIGYSNSFHRFPDRFPPGSELVSSDELVGTTNAHFWRTTTSKGVIYDNEGLAPRAYTQDNAEQHFPQDPTGAGGYCTLLGLQLLRDNPTSKTVRVMIPSKPKSGDMLYTNTPTLTVLEAALTTWPPSQQLGPVTLSRLPEAFYFYWPFHNSRLRIHAYGILKAD
jgi:hypothetical protein